MTKPANIIWWSATITKKHGLEKINEENIEWLTFLSMQTSNITSSLRGSALRIKPWLNSTKFRTAVELSLRRVTLSPHLLWNLIVLTNTKITDTTYSSTVNIISSNIIITVFQPHSIIYTGHRGTLAPMC